MSMKVDLSFLYKNAYFTNNKSLSIKLLKCQYHLP